MITAKPEKNASTNDRNETARSRVPTASGMRAPQSWSNLDLTTTTTGLVALYARVSTKEHGQNVETQLVPLRDWAQAQSRPIGEYIDLASGKDLNRPAWKRLTADWRAGRVRTIAVLRLDRAFRSVSDMHSCFAEWEGRGVRFASITQPIDTGTPAGKMITTILGAFAEFERDLIGERVREGLTRALSEGKKLGRPRSRLSPSRAQRTMDAYAGDVDAAAKDLGVSRATLYRRLKKVG